MSLPGVGGAHKEGKQAVREELAGLRAPGDATAAGDPEELDGTCSLE